tara:strand:- start:1357 stop:1830 length:474 start_codon:yes stop_codon:yes gene_type:complete
MSDIPYFDSRAAFALRVRQASADLYEQMDECLQAHGLILPAYTTSLVQTLHHVGPQSVAALADELDLSHQLASQRLKWLVNEGLVEIGDDPDDRRRRQVKLTAAGKREAQKLQAFLPMLERAYSDVFDEIGVDLHRGLIEARTALQTRSLLARMPPG